MKNFVDLNVIWLVTVEHGKSCDTISFLKLKMPVVSLGVPWKLKNVTFD